MKKLITLIYLLGAFTLGLNAQTGGDTQTKKDIQGVVYDENKDPIGGATIGIKNSTRGVITDSDGKFSLNVSPKDVLIVRYLGYQEQEVETTQGSSFVVNLQLKQDALGELTVVGFAKQKKESVISSITTIKPADLKIPSSNLTNALAGRMSGIISYQTSGEPGQDNANFFVRGVTTFGYKSSPLILIDNVELTTDDLARLNVDDIASFSIMKDATATAVYGARGANGVIMVTTKEGREGKVRVNLRLENSLSMPSFNIDLADPVTYMRLENESVLTRNPKGELIHTESAIANTANGTNPYVYPAVNWYDEMFNKYSMNQRANLSINGGGTMARYYIAASYSKENGLLKTDSHNNFNTNIDLQKYSVRSNVNIDLTKTTEMVVRFSGSFDDYIGPMDGGNILYGRAMRTSPVLFPKYFPANGSGVEHTMFGNITSQQPYTNPYADMVSGYKTYKRALILAQGEVNQKLDFVTKGLNVRALMNLTRYSYTDVSRGYKPFYYRADQGSYNPQTGEYKIVPINPTTGTNHLDYSEGPGEIKSTNYTELATNYAREFDVHGVSAMMVYTFREEIRSNAGSLYESLPYRNQGVSGRFTYSYDKRYFSELNFGYNGSERFAKKERYGFFPSAGLGYIMSNEKFFKPYEKVVNKLKFKATYGLVGNDAIGDPKTRFFYLSEVNMYNDDRGQSFGSEYGNYLQGISNTRYANDQITWETARKLNVGFELGLFNKMELIVDIFSEKRENILMERSEIPSTMGLAAKVISNYGRASSKGVDISLDYNESITKDFWIQARGNFTFATSEYDRVDEPDYGSAGTPWRYLVGNSLSQQKGYIAERLFVDDADVFNSPTQNFGGYTQAGDIKYKDLNNDGKITEADITTIGYPKVPKITYGFGFSAGYKNFDASVFFQGNALSSFWIDPRQVAPFIDSDEFAEEERGKSYKSSNAMLAKIADNHWSESNRDIYAFWPRLSHEVSGNNSQVSTWWMQDGTFFRLKTLEFGYTLPNKLTKKLGIEMTRVYVSGTNLFTLSKFKLWDPEMGSYGLGYPLQRVFNVGMSINF